MDWPGMCCIESLISKSVGSHFSGGGNRGPRQGQQTVRVVVFLALGRGKHELQEWTQAFFIFYF